MKEYDYTEDQLSDLQEFLKSKSSERCERCERVFDFGDVAWNNACTEYGTGYCVVEINCFKCGQPVSRMTSWYPSIDNINELISVIKEEL